MTPDHRQALRVVAGALLLWVMTVAPLAADPPDLSGEWRVVYHDTGLGPISGTASITDQKVWVHVRNPYTAEWFDLDGRITERSDTRILVTLEGRSPHADDLPDGLSDPADPILVPPDGGALTVARGGDAITHPVAPRPPSDGDRVTVDFTLSEDGRTLAGRWRYRADPYLGTDHRGLGRRGEIFQEDDGGWVASGREVWTRPQVAVFGTVVLTDQMDRETFSDGTAMPYFPYPFGPDRSEPSVSRTLFVFGRDLPTDWQRSVRIEAVDPGIRYRIRYRSAQQDDNPDVAALFEEGWARVRGRLRAQGIPEWRINEQLADASAVIVRATVLPDSVPGYNSFTIDGSETAWLLAYGDNTGELRPVRRTGVHAHDWERVHTAFAGERIRIEVRSVHRLPVSEIPVMIGVNGTPVLTGTGTGIPARRTAADPHLYRTDPIQLDPWLEAGSVAVPQDAVPQDAVPQDAVPWYRVGVRQGDRVSAVSGRPGLFSIAPNLAQVTVFGTPRDTGVGGAWPVFLAQAAACAGVAGGGRVATERAEADRITEFLIDSGRARLPVPGWLDTKVTVGQHAAMLLLRDTYVRLMLRGEAQLRRLRSDRDITLYRRTIEALIRQGAHPLTRIEVRGPTGTPTGFAWTFDTNIIARVAGVARDEADAWALAATREALQKQRAVMTTETERVQAIDPCDVEALLRLTGFAFDPVARIAASKLMRRGPKPFYWLPDRPARGWVETVAYVGEQLDIQDRLGAEDTRAALTAVGLATLPVAIFGGALGSGAAAIAVALVDVADISYGLYAALAEKWQADAEIQFAQASAGVLGLARLERAEARGVTWTKLLFGRLLCTVGPAALGLGIDTPAVFRAFRDGLTIRRVARGSAALRAASGVTDDAGATVARLRRTEDALADILTDPDGARGTGALDPVDPRADAPPAGSAPDLGEPPLRVGADDLLEVSDQAAADLAAALSRLDADDLAPRPPSPVDPASFDHLDVALGTHRPAWAEAFDAADFDRLQRLLTTRPDLMALLNSAGEALGITLRRADEARRAAAWRLLEYEPGLDSARFTERLNALVEQAPQPRGRGYFDQAAPDDTEIVQALERRGWRFDPDSTGGGYDIRDPSGNVGRLVRGYDPATETFTMSVAYRQWVGSPGRIAGTIEDVARVPSSGNRLITMDYFQFRAMLQRGVRYGAAAGSPGAITRAVMEHIANPVTIVQVNWWKRTYFPGTAWADIPAEEVSRMLMTTHSVTYAQRVLAGAGYRIRGARIIPERGRAGNLPLFAFADDFASETETWGEFLARHGLDEQTRADVSFNLDLDVEPW